LKDTKIEKSGQFVIHWEFSTTTLRSWPRLLAIILGQLELAIKATKEAREKNWREAQIRGLGDIHGWCHPLYANAHWEEGVVKTLLTKTSLASAFSLRVGLDIGSMQIYRLASSPDVIPS
jgi:hypothetical protein